jgi:hypothetical protein
MITRLFLVSIKMGQVQNDRAGAPVGDPKGRG